MESFFLCGGDVLPRIATDAWRVFCVWKMVLGRIAAGMESFSMQDVLARIAAPWRVSMCEIADA
jgi:hypothetical protein